MQQLTYVKKNTLQWWDVEAPELKTPNDVIARPIAAARCDADKAFLFYDATRLLKAGIAVHYIDPVVKLIFGKDPFKGPIPIGHECVAEVVKCGENVQNFKAGDKVIIPWAISCGTCSHCLSDLTSRCLNAGKGEEEEEGEGDRTMFSAYGFGKAMGPWGGMMSDFILVPFADQMMVGVPDDIDHLSLASASDNIPDGWRTVAPQLKQKPGAAVLVMGGSAASVGLYAAGIAVAMGAAKVDYLDCSESRLEIAKSMGANPVLIPKKGKSKWYRKNVRDIREKYAIVSDCSMNEDGLNYAMRSLATGGICTSVGFYFKKGTALPLMHMYGNDSTFHTGISHARASLPEVLDLVRTGKFRPEKVTTVLAKWEDADQAYLERTTKVVLHRPSMF